MSVLKDTAPGIAITLTIAVISQLTASLHPSFDSLVISIIFGMLVSNMFGDREIIERGSRKALNVSLPLGIGLYGMQLQVAGTAPHLWQIAASIAGIFALFFAVTYFISKGFGLDKQLSVLLATGMSVCGASAIIIIAPLIGSKKENTTISILSVMTVGLTGMLLYRFMPQVLGLSIQKFSLLAGATLPMVGQVKVAASAMGPESFAAALNIKLLRIAFIAVLAAAVIFGGKRRLYVPWFMLIFFLLAALVNISETAASYKAFFGHLCGFFLSIALAAIGLSIDFDSITEKGATPLLAAFLSWGIVSTAVYLILIIAV